MWRVSQQGRPEYVANKPGGGADWGYTDKSGKAIVLSRYWQRRFRRDCMRVERVAFPREVVKHADPGTSRRGEQ